MLRSRLTVTPREGLRAVMGNKSADGFEIRVQGRIGLAKTEIGGAQGVWQAGHGTWRSWCIARLRHPSRCCRMRNALLGVKQDSIGALIFNSGIIVCTAEPFHQE